MQIAIEKDSSKGSFLRYGKSSLLILAAVIPANYFFHLSQTVTAGLVLFIIPFTLWTYWGRNKWGDQLVFDEQFLEIKKAGSTVHRIEAPLLTSKSVRKDCALLVWPISGKRQVVVIGRESFSDGNWEIFSNTLQGFGA